MKLIVMTQPTYFVEEDKVITALFEEGLDVLHLRKPGVLPVYAERLLTLLPEKYHKRIVTHEHFYLKEEFKLMGIHLEEDGETERPLGYNGYISCTCSSLGELRQRRRDDFDHLFLKLPAGRGTGLHDEVWQQLRKASHERIIDHKTVAWSEDITPEDVERLADCGFGGVAVMDSLWSRFDLCFDNDYMELLHYFRLLRKRAD